MAEWVDSKYKSNTANLTIVLEQRRLQLLILYNYSSFLFLGVVHNQCPVGVNNELIHWFWAQNVTSAKLS